MSEFSGYLEVIEIHKIIAAVKLVSKNPERDQLLLEVMWQTGGRVSEACQLVPEHVGTTSIVLNNLKQVKRIKGPDEKMIRVHNPDAMKEVEVSVDLCQRIKDFCEKHSIKKGDWIFKSSHGGKFLNRWYIWDLVTRASEKAQVFKFGKRHPKTGGKFKGAFPHHFRHSLAMFLLEQTSDLDLVRQQLGHSRITTTQIYAYTKTPKIKKAIAAIKW